jgi:hypothetical protein
MEACLKIQSKTIDKVNIHKAIVADRSVNQPVVAGERTASRKHLTGVAPREWARTIDLAGNNRLLCR